MTYDARGRSVGELLNDDVCLSVPRYQRGYVWEEKHWKDLLRDITTSYKNGIYKHFLGTFVFEDIIEDGSTSIYSTNIIDGQQRITSLQILICSLIYVFKKHILESPELSAELFEEISRRIEILQKYLYFRDIKTTRNKMKLDNGVDSFNKLLDLSLTLCGKRSEVNIADYDELPNDIVSSAFWFMSKYIEDSVVDKSNFVKSIVDFLSAMLSMNVIVVRSSDQNEVINLFEVLNARGLYLKQIELLKNFIFRNLAPSKLRDEVKIEWLKLYNALYENNIDPDQFLLHFMRSYYDFKTLKQDEIYEKLKEFEFKTNYENVNTLFQWLKKCYKHYIIIATNKGSNVIEKRIYDYFIVKKNIQIRSLLLSLRIKHQEQLMNDDQYTEMLILIRNFFVGFNLLTNSSNQLEKHLYEASSNIFRAKNFAEVRMNIYSFLSKVSQFYPSVDDIERSILNIRYSNKSRKGNTRKDLVVYFLEHLYEAKKIEKDIEIPYKKLSIEHVIPDNGQDPLTWKLGNILLMTEGFNRKLKNKTYAEKKSFISRSEINFNRLFTEEYESFDLGNVSTRTKLLMSEIKSYFSFSPDDIILIEKMESKYEKIHKTICEDIEDNKKLRDKLNELGVTDFMKYVEKNLAIDDDIKQIIKKASQ